MISGPAVVHGDKNHAIRRGLLEHIKYLVGRTEDKSSRMIPKEHTGQNVYIKTGKRFIANVSFVFVRLEPSDKLW